MIESGYKQWGRKYLSNYMEVVVINWQRGHWILAMHEEDIWLSYGHSEARIPFW